MIADKINKYYGVDFDLNCAETILYAGNDEYNLNLTSDVFKTQAGFGGGMAVEGVCGALAGGISLISIMFTEDRAHKSPIVKELTNELYTEFKNRLSDDNCKLLKEKYRNENDRCKTMLLTVGEIVDKIIQRERQIGLQKN